MAERVPLQRFGIRRQTAREFATSVKGREPLMERGWASSVWGHGEIT
jgi:hypothetical protein